jgi:hypothetical protein
MMTTQNRYDTGLNYVVADQPPAPIDQTSLIRRNDVMQAVGGVIEAYRVQQSALLDSVTGETVQGRGFLSDAGQVAERRKTSRLYLFYYTVIVGMVAGGLVLLAHGARLSGRGRLLRNLAGVDGRAGAAAGLEAARRRACADAGEHRPARGGCSRDGGSLRVRNRRLAIEWEHGAEARRQAAQERAAEYARQQAQLRIDELDARRKAIEAQRSQADPYEGRFRVVMGTEPEPSKGTEGRHRTDHSDHQRHHGRSLARQPAGVARHALSARRRHGGRRHPHDGALVGTVVVDGAGQGRSQAGHVRYEAGADRP